jgi:ribonuclease Z
MLMPIIQMQLDVSGSVLPYQLHFHPLGDDGVLVDNSKFSIHSFRVYHRIDCWGFIIREKKKPRRIDKEKAVAYHIPLAYYERLKNGDDYEMRSGEVIKNEWVTVANAPGKSYAYCADTVFAPSIAEKVKDVSMLYHETTYLKKLSDRAAERFHSTTEQAGQIARMANAGQLLIGHFSSKYEQLDEFLSEACEVFPNTQLALEGVTYLVG